MKNSCQIIWFSLSDIEIDAPKTDKGALSYTQNQICCLNSPTKVSTRLDHRHACQHISGPDGLPIMVSCRFVVCNENQESGFEELVTTFIDRKCLSHMQGTVSAWLKTQNQCIQNCQAQINKLQCKEWWCAMRQAELEISHIKLLLCHDRHDGGRRLASPRNPTEMIGPRRSHCVPTIPATLLTVVKPWMGDRSTTLLGLAHAGFFISMRLGQDECGLRIVSASRHRMALLNSSR